MVKKSNQIYPSKRGWVVKKIGALRASRVFDTKLKAINYGTELSKSEKTLLYIHKSNGMVEKRSSFID